MESDDDKTETVMVNARVPVDLVREWSELCEARCLNRSAVIRSWIERHVAEMQRGELQNGTQSEGN